MSEPLDVSLRVRLAYEAGGARLALADMDALRAKAAQLGTGAGAGQLGRDLSRVAPAAAAAKRDMADLTAAAAKLGATTAGTKTAADLHKIAPAASGAKRDVVDLAAAATRLGNTDAGAKTAVDLGRIAPAAAVAKRDVLDLSAAAVRFRNTDLGVNLRRDFERLSVLVRAGQRDILQLGRTVDGLGASTGPRALDRELDAVGRHADEARIKIERVARAGGAALHGRESGRGSRFGAFAEDAIQMAAPAGAMQFGGGLVGLAAGAGVYEVGRGLKAATDQAIAFETAMSEVNKAVNNLSPDGLKDLETTILNISRQTGIAHVEMAKLVAQAGYAGVPNEDLARFATFGAKTAGAFEMSPEEAGDKLAKMRNVYALNQAGIEDLADGINLLGDTTAAKEREIIDFMTRVGAASQTIGFKPLQTAAFGATMEATGMEPDVAATSMNAMLEKMATADKQPKHFKDALQQLHLSGRGLMREMKDNPLEAVLDVLKRINALPKEKQLGVVTELVGLEHSRSITTLAGQVDNLRANLGRMEDQGQRAGSVEKTFAIFNATTKAKIDRMNEAVGTFAVKLGERLAPAAGAAADAIARFFNTLNEGAERSEKAGSIVDKVVKGLTLSPEDRKALDADPKLKADIDRRLKTEERAQDMRDDAQDGRQPPAVPAKTPPPHVPDAEDAAAAAARDRAKARELDRIRELEARVKRGGIAPGERSRLRDMISRYTATFGEPPDGVTFGAPRFVPKYAPDAAPAAPAAPTPAAPVSPQIAPPERQGALAEPGLIQRAAFRYGGDVEASPAGGLQGIIEAGTHSGVVAGLREVLELRGSESRGGVAPGIVKASFETGGDAGSSAAGSTGGGSAAGMGSAGAARRASMRYGGGRRGNASLGVSAEAGPATPLGRTGARFDGKAPAIMRGLMDRYGVTREQAAGVVGNLGHESAGFTAYHEGGQAPGRGGVGWAQWTGPRRRAFEAWTQAHGLNPTSDDASWRYLTEGDPETKGAIEAVKKTHDAHGAAVAFEKSFERAGVKGYGSRFKYADRALALGPGEAQAASGASTPFLDPAQRKDAMRRAEERTRLPAPAETVSPRFSDPGMTSASLRSADAPSSSGGRPAGQVAAAAPTVQHFYGNHDPAQTARYAMLEQNREIRRTQARALHSIGRVA